MVVKIDVLTSYTNWSREAASKTIKRVLSVESVGFNILVVNHKQMLFPIKLSVAQRFYSTKYGLIVSILASNKTYNEVK